MKKYSIQLIQLFVDTNIIENQVFLIQDQHYHKVDELTPSNISEGFIIYKKISV